MIGNSSSFYKNIYNILIIFFALAFFSCKADETNGITGKPLEPFRWQGKTMGTTYNISCFDTLTGNVNLGVDSLLNAINSEINTYQAEAIISQINTNKEQLRFTFPIKKVKHFVSIYQAAFEVHQASKGYFDPTVMPLVNYYGFGYQHQKDLKQIDSVAIKNVLQSVGLEKISLQVADTFVTITRQVPQVQLDFSAIAKGYAVDKIAELLQAQGATSFLVEIGGEVVCYGKKPNDSPWVLGINTPSEEASTRDIFTKVSLENKGMATSGNYRNFYEVDGKKISHTISPKTGFPVRSNLLSATVIADNCMLADAYATAFMTMGLEAAKQLAEAKGLAAYFIYTGEKGDFETYESPTIKQNLQD